MNLPQSGDFINIHTHGDKPAEGIFIIENLMAHEQEDFSPEAGVAYTIGLHPWFFGANNYEKFIVKVKEAAADNKIVAIGEAGFDKLRGASPVLQQKVFEEQVAIAEEYNKPLIIHCVKGWDELLATHKKLKPSTPWLIHGFHGKKEVARQLLSRGMYISVWYSFALIPESAELIRVIPRDRLFLETDGADVDIRTIYMKVASDLDLSVDELKSIILSNFNELFIHSDR
ncbi:MAG: TatD family hydrolase [Bacteroidia bacterium]|nr:TatD family hydrolase [Bacteroidia bacterium]